MNVKKGKSVYKVTKSGRIPAEWEVGTFSDLAEVIMGQSPLGKTYNKNGNGIPLINGPTEFTNRFPIKIQWTSSPTKVSKRGDILLCVRGSSTGRINISDDKYCIGRGIAAIRAKKIADINFLENELRFEIGRILKLTTGSTFPNIDSNSLRNRLVLIPPLPEQQKIARILSTWDKAIEKTEQLISQKQKLKKGLMQQLLTGKVRFKEFVKSTKTKKTKAGQIPQDWDVKKLKDISTFLDGARRPLEASERIPGPYPYYGATGIIDFVNGYIFDEDIILLGEDGANIVSRNQPLVYQVSGKVWVNNHAHVIRAGKEMNWGFLAKSLDLIDYTKYNSGTAQPKLNKEACSNIEILQPPLDEQVKIDALISYLDKTDCLLKFKLSELKRQKIGLMERLLVGKLRVKNK